MSNNLNPLSKVAIFVACTGVSFFPLTSHATIITGTSSAYGESLSLSTSLAGVIGASVTSGPLPTASGTAPAPYSQTNTAVSALVTIFASSLSTGLLSATAASTVDGGSGPKITSGSATVDGLALGLTGLLGLSATTVQSSAAIGGDFGGLTPTGFTTITGLMLNGNAVSVGSTPNFVLLNDPLLGIEITLNEQTVTGDGTSNESMTVNAIDIDLTNSLLGVETLNGHIVIGQSVASEAARPGAVPEPASFAVLGASLLGLAGVKRRRFGQPVDMT